MPTSIQRAKKILKLNAEIKKLYKRLDFQEAALLKEIPNYGGYYCNEGQNKIYYSIEMLDNFKDTNICWRPAKVKRFQIRIKLNGKKVY